jgi:hypothetical protein
MRTVTLTLRHLQSALFLSICIAATVVLAGCGGGGSGSGSTPLTLANTSSNHYLPLSAGNTWTLASGGSLTDEGPITLSCSCPENGHAIERVDAFQPVSDGLVGSFYFAKYTPTGATSELTTLVGIEQAGATTMTITSSASYPYGLSIMDDSPSAGESWNDSIGDISTINSVDGTMSIAGNQQIINVAADTISSSSSSSSGSFGWSFAKGVGFAAISEGGQSTNLSSFSINALQSTALAPRRVVAGLASSKPIGVAALLAGLLRAP